MFRVFKADPERETFLKSKLYQAEEKAKDHTRFFLGIKENL